MTVRPSDLLQARDVEWEVVASSNVHSALWNQSEGGDMYVRFLRSGADDIYTYTGRSQPEWLSFQAAASKGGWIWEHPIEEGWPYELLTRRRFPRPGDLDVPAPTRSFLSPL